MKQYEKNCKICKKPFFTDKGKGYYCSDECRQKARNIKRQANRENEREARAREERMLHHKNSQEALVRMAIEARERGMTYGEYMVYLYWEEERAKRTKRKK